MGAVIYDTLCNAGVNNKHSYLPGLTLVTKTYKLKRTIEQARYKLLLGGFCKNKTKININFN